MSQETRQPKQSFDLRVVRLEFIPLGNYHFLRKQQRKCYLIDSLSLALRQRSRFYGRTLTGCFHDSVLGGCSPFQKAILGRAPSYS